MSDVADTSLVKSTDIVSTRKFPGDVRLVYVLCVVYVVCVECIVCIMCSVSVCNVCVFVCVIS